MTSRRFLIVNADDLGLSPGVNRGIIQAHEQGIVTSASLMVRRAAAPEAADYARNHPGLSVGLHVDLCEWVFTNGQWQAAYEIVPANDAAAVAAEITRQLKAFYELTGLAPTHLDSHQHVHRSEPARSVLLAHARRLGVILRGEDPAVRYCGEFYGQSDKGYPYPEGITVDALLKIIQLLPAGTTELGCHPGQEADADSVYRLERDIECRTLCDSRIGEALRAQNISLSSFRPAPCESVPEGEKEC